MRNRRIPTTACAWAAAITLAAAASAAPLFAQSTGVIEGQVTEHETGRPLPNVQVIVDGTELRAITNSAGWFRLAGVPAGRVPVRLELADYATTVEPLAVEAGTVTLVEYRLAGISALLDRLLVMAESSGPEFQDRDQGATIRHLEPTAATHTGNYSLGELLRGRVPGLNVTRSGGQVGSGYRLLLRGVNSISLGNEPLIYLDGILLSSPSTGFEGRLAASNPLEFIDPFSIDRIEVLSGPAASVQYGAGAANGVILIYTKRGSQG